jgi:hypothetical protein
MSKKMSEGDAQRRLVEHAKADVSEYQRNIIGNAGLEANLRDIRRSFGLPFLDWKEYLAYFNDQIDHQEFESLVEFGREIDGLVGAHHVEKWRNEVQSWAIYGIPPEVRGSSGGPYLSGSRARGLSIVIPADFDATNPLSQVLLKAMQAAVEPCPRPIQIRNRIDWRPVWEWGKRHPNFTRMEIARLLGYAPSYLRHKLEALDTL